MSTQDTALTAYRSRRSEYAAALQTGDTPWIVEQTLAGALLPNAPRLVRATIRPPQDMPDGSQTEGENGQAEPAAG